MTYFKQIFLICVINKYLQFHMCINFYIIRYKYKYESYFVFSLWLYYVKKMNIINLTCLLLNHCYHMFKVFVYIYKKADGQLLYMQYKQINKYNMFVQHSWYLVYLWKSPYFKLKLLKTCLHLLLLSFFLFSLSFLIFFKISCGSCCRWQVQMLGDIASFYVTNLVLLFVVFALLVTKTIYYIKHNNDYDSLFSF